MANASTVVQSTDPVVHSQYNNLRLDAIGPYNAERVWNDNQHARFGTLGADGDIYSDGVDLFIDNPSGNPINLQVGGVTRLQVTSSGFNLVGDQLFNDNEKIIFGDGSDVEMYWNGTVFVISPSVPVSSGGTGASDAATARANLGLAIGSNVQAWDADLDAWAGIAPPAGDVVGTTDAQTLTNKTIDDAAGSNIHADTVHVRLRNESGVALTRGDAVYISGYHVGSNTATVSIASAAAAGTMPAIAILTEATLANNSTGDFTVVGRIQNANTAAWSAGDVLYISATGTTTNTLTSTKPTGGSLVQKVATVLRSHASNGVLQIYNTGRSAGLPNLANTKIWIGDINGVPQQFSLSGDVTMTAGGVTSVGTLSSVSVTGGSITGITDLAIADGGTGASSASAARTNLGVAIGSDVQAYDIELAAIAGLTSAANKIIRFTGSGTAGLLDFLDEDSMASNSATAVASQQSIKAYVDGAVGGSGTLLAANNLSDLANAATARTNLGVAIGSDVQAYDADLAAIAGLSSVDGNFIVGSAGGWVAESGATARTSLGVDAAGTDNSTDVTLAGAYNYLTIAGQVITLGQIDLTTDVTGDLPVADGGTGASTAAAARTNLGVDAAGTDNSTDVTLAGSYNYLTIAGQVITLAQIDLATDVTGSFSETQGGTGQTTYATGDMLYASASNTLSKLAAATNGDVLTLAGGVPSWQTPGAPGAHAASHQNGGGDEISVTGLSGVLADDQHVIDSEVDARITAATGVSVQAYDANLGQIAALAVTDGNFIVGNGSAWVAESGATVRTSLGLGSLATLSSVNNDNWSGTDLSVANGGTGVSSLTDHGVLLGSGSGAVSVTGTGTSGQVLTSNGASSDPTFQDAGGGGASSGLAITMALVFRI